MFPGMLRALFGRDWKKAGVPHPVDKAAWGCFKISCYYFIVAPDNFGIVSFDFCSCVLLEVGY